MASTTKVTLSVLADPTRPDIEEVSFLLKRRASSSGEAYARSAWQLNNQETVKARRDAAARGFVAAESHAQKLLSARKHQ